MRDLYTKLVEVFPGDTLLLESGEEWPITGDLRYILIEESSQVLPTGDRKVRVRFDQLKLRAKKAREYPR